MILKQYCGINWELVEHSASLPGAILPSSGSSNALQANVHKNKPVCCTSIKLNTNFYFRGKSFTITSSQ